MRKFSSQFLDNQPFYTNPHFDIIRLTLLSLLAPDPLPKRAREKGKTFVHKCVYWMIISSGSR